MSSENELCSQASCFLGREAHAFGQLKAALYAQAEALKTFNIEALESRQIALETAIAGTENSVFHRVKWQQSHFPDLPEPTWSNLFDVLPSAFREVHQGQLEALRIDTEAVKRALFENQSYTHAAREMLVSLRGIERRVIQEKTDLYTAKGTLSGQVALSAVSGGRR